VLLFFFRVFFFSQDVLLPFFNQRFDYSLNQDVLSIDGPIIGEKFLKQLHFILKSLFFPLAYSIIDESSHEVRSVTKYGNHRPILFQNIVDALYNVLNRIFALKLMVYINLQCPRICQIKTFHCVVDFPINGEEISLAFYIQTLNPLFHFSLQSEARFIHHRNDVVDP
jgi:hypothetical protein